MKFYQLLIILIFASCQMATRDLASTKTEVIDIVFDLDWTLIKHLKRGEDLSGANILTHNGDKYRLNDGVLELLAYLKDRENIRISFFSGGEFDRNSAVLSQIMVGDTNAKEMAYKILSKRDLDVLSTDPSKTFTDRFKKNLYKVNNNLENVLLVDDDIRFARDFSQQRNFLWLESVKYHFEDPKMIYEGVGPFDPKSKESWFFDKNKIYMVHDIIKRSIEDDGVFIDSIHKNSKKWDFKRNKFKKGQSIEFLKKFKSRDCNDLAFKFLIAS